MSATQNLETEIRWQRSVLREAENKNGRYPWNILDYEKLKDNTQSLDKPKLPPKSLKSISFNIIHNKNPQKSQQDTDIPLNSSRIENFHADQQEYRIKKTQTNTRRLSVALDNFIQGVDVIEKELKDLKSAARLTKNFKIDKEN